MPRAVCAAVGVVHGIVPADGAAHITLFEIGSNLGVGKRAEGEGDVAGATDVAEIVAPVCLVLMEEVDAQREFAREERHVEIGVEPGIFLVASLHAEFAEGAAELGALR